MFFGPVMLDLEATVLSTAERELLAHPRVGGVIFFARNYESPAQIRALVEAIRAIKPEILIAVDQEGGRVQRFREGFTRIPAMQQFLPLYRKNAQATLSLVQNAAWLMATELLAVGVDISFAPVLDVDDSHCRVIADRSFSPEPDEVVALAAAWMAGMYEAGMATTGKHFPGHGHVTTDSHLVLPVDTRDFDAIAKKDLIPFIELQSKLDAVMPAHILFSNIDSQHTVGFSQHWLQTVLRDGLKFDGVIFSDDLTMEGAASAGSFSERATLALAAGCDMVLVCNHRQGAVEILQNKAILVGDRIDASQRIKRMIGKPNIAWDDVKQMPRWQLTRQLLNVIKP